MTLHAIYCSACQRTYPSDGGFFAVPCGHRTEKVRMVHVTREIVGPYERLSLCLRNAAQATVWLRPDGNGGLRVEPCGSKILSLEAWLSGLEPALAEAFRRRADVARQPPAWRVAELEAEGYYDRR